MRTLLYGEIEIHANQCQRTKNYHFRRSTPASRNQVPVSLHLLCASKSHSCQPVMERTSLRLILEMCSPLENECCWELRTFSFPRKHAKPVCLFETLKLNVFLITFETCPENVLFMFSTSESWRLILRKNSVELGIVYRLHNNLRTLEQIMYTNVPLPSDAKEPPRPYTLQ